MKTSSNQAFSWTHAAAFAIVAAFALSWLGMLAWHEPARAGERAVAIPAPVLDEQAGSRSVETTVLAGGCFWGVQGVFEHVRGVIKAVSGYTGGAHLTAHYDAVSTGLTGHAESVEITWDPRQITYGQLLRIYFSVAHDPTQVDRQGPDSGSQYRSTIFPADAEQQKIAKAYIAELDRAGVYRAPIATTIEMDQAFYPAEDYHQDFLARNPTYGYIVVNDLPKIDNLKRLFPARYRDPPALVDVSVH